MFPIPFNFPFRKKDGSVTTIDAAISGGGTPYTLPTASAEIKGGVKIGSGLTMDGETLNNSNPTPYSLPTASAETKGGVKIGSGLSIDENGVLSVNGGGGGMTLTPIDTTSHSGALVTINDVELDEHDGLLIKLRATSASCEVERIFNRVATSGVESYYAQIWDNFVCAIRTIQFNFSTHQLALNTSRYINFGEGGGNPAESSAYCYITGLYYVDYN